MVAEPTLSGALAMSTLFTVEESDRFPRRWAEPKAHMSYQCEGLGCPGCSDCTDPGVTCTVRIVPAPAVVDGFTLGDLAGACEGREPDEVALLIEAWANTQVRAAPTMSQAEAYGFAQRMEQTLAPLAARHGLVTSIRITA